MIKSHLCYKISNIKLSICGVSLCDIDLLINNVSFRIIALYRPNPSKLISFIDELDTKLTRTTKQAY